MVENKGTEAQKRLANALQQTVAEHKNTRALVAAMVFQAYVSARPASFNIRSADTKRAIKEWVEWLMEEI